MTFSIREARLADAAQIHALYIETFTETFGHRYPHQDLANFLQNMDREHFEERLANPENIILVGESGDEVTGYILLAELPVPLDDHRPRWMLRQLYLNKKAQGTGLAQALLDDAIERSKALGKMEMLLTVLDDNHRARRFYARAGFTEIGNCDFPVGNHTDHDFIMRLALG